MTIKTYESVRCSHGITKEENNMLISPVSVNSRLEDIIVKRWKLGGCLIAIGVLISIGVSSYVISEEIFMLNPKYKNFLLGSAFGIPALIFGLGYALWYHRCAIQKSRTQSVYKGQWFWMLLIVILEYSALFVVFGMIGLIEGEVVYYIANCLVPAIFFCAAFLFCKPF